MGSEEEEEVVAVSADAATHGFGRVQRELRQALRLRRRVQPPDRHTRRHGGAAAGEEAGGEREATCRASHARTNSPHPILAVHSLQVARRGRISNSGRPPIHTTRPTSSRCAAQLVRRTIGISISPCKGRAAADASRPVRSPRGRPSAEAMPLALAQLQDLRDRLSDSLRPWSRSAQFWIRAADIYTSYKVCQLRVGFVRDEEEREAMWEQQHELGAQKMYSLCSELGGLFLKAAQILGKPDLAPMAWVKKLVTLCDKAPATPIDVVRDVVEKQFGKSFDKIFECFDVEPVGSASIAQVHRAKLKLSKTDVAVKVQHPGAEHLMMVDIRNMQACALFLQKYDLNFDMYSATKEMEKQICYEFDFVREARAMERIREFLRVSNKKPPVIVPRVIPGMVSREVLVMEFIEGTPIMNLGNEMAKRGIDPGGKLAAMAKQKILTDLTLAYGQMILKDGFFHADPHPGNILICKNTEVALLDYGQVKEMPEDLRLAYANLVIAMADDDFLRTKESFREFGIKTWSIADNELEELFQLSLRMFDTRLPPGVTVLSPFAEDSSLNKVGVQSFPEELFSVLRTIQLLRGLTVGMGLSFSCAQQWRPIAEEALLKAGRLKAADVKSRSPRRSFLGRLFWRSRDNDSQIT